MTMFRVILVLSTAYMAADGSSRDTSFPLQRAWIEPEARRTLPRHGAGVLTADLNSAAGSTEGISGELSKAATIAGTPGHGFGSSLPAAAWPRPAHHRHSFHQTLCARADIQGDVRNSRALEQFCSSQRGICKPAMQKGSS